MATTWSCVWSVWLAGGPRWKTCSFSVSLLTNVSLRLQFADLSNISKLLVSPVRTKSVSIKLKHFISPKLVLRKPHQMCSNFSRVKLVILIILFQILWMFLLWLVFTSRLSSQTTWLKVKPIVNPCTVSWRRPTSLRSKSLYCVMMQTYFIKIIKINVTSPWWSEWCQVVPLATCQHS